MRRFVVALLLMLCLGAFSEARAQEGGEPDAFLLGKRYPEVQAVIDEAYSGDPLIKEAIENSINQFIILALSQEFSQQFLSRLSMDSTAFLDAMFSDADYLSLSLTQGFAKFKTDVTVSMAEGVMIDVLSTQLVEMLLDTPAFDWVRDDFTSAFMRPVLTTMAKEFAYAAWSYGKDPTTGLPKAVLSAAWRRVWDVVDIYKASRGVFDTYDGLILSTIAAIESTSEMHVLAKTDKARRFSSQLFADIQRNALGYAGHDAPVEMGRILSLTRVGLIRQLQNDQAGAIKARDEILKIGGTSANLSSDLVCSTEEGWGAWANFDKGSPERAAQIAVNCTALRALPAVFRPSGALCKSASGALTEQEIGEEFVGARIDGADVKGRKWVEYLATNNHTILDGTSGKMIVGKYRVQGSKLCFSYNNSESWSCKSVEPCISGEGLYVLVDDNQIQTSTIEAIKPGLADAFHDNRWRDLAASQWFFDPEIERRVRSFTAIPASHQSAIFRLESALAVDGYNVRIDRQSCRMTVEKRTALTKPRSQTGGWIGVLESTGGGTKSAGFELVRHRIDLESITSVSEGTAGNHGWVVMMPEDDAAHLLTNQVSSNFDPSKDKLLRAHKTGGIRVKSSNIPMATSTLETLTRICRGEPSAGSDSAQESSETADFSGCREVGKAPTAQELISAFSEATFVESYAGSDIADTRYEVGPLRRENEFSSLTSFTPDGMPTVPRKIKVVGSSLCEENKYGEFCSVVKRCDSDDALYVLSSGSDTPRYVVSLEQNSAAAVKVEPEVTEPSTGLMSKIQFCAEKKDYAERLACFDGLLCTSATSDLERLGCFDALAQGNSVEIPGSAAPKPATLTSQERAQIVDLVRRGDEGVTASLEGCFLVRHFQRYNNFYKSQEESYRQFDLSVVDLEKTGDIQRGSFGEYGYRVVAKLGKTFLHRGIEAKTSNSYTRQVRAMAIVFSKYNVRDYEVDEFDKLLKKAIRSCQGGIVEGKTHRFSEEEVIEIASRYLLGNLYGQNLSDVRRNITDVTFGESQTCSGMTGWIVTVHVPGNSSRGAIDGQMVIEDQNGEPNCVGLPGLH